MLGILTEVLAIAADHVSKASAISQLLCHCQHILAPGVRKASRSIPPLPGELGLFPMLTLYLGLFHHWANCDQLNVVFSADPSSTLQTYCKLTQLHVLLGGSQLLLFIKGINEEPGKAGHEKVAIVLKQRKMAASLYVRMCAAKSGPSLCGSSRLRYVSKRSRMRACRVPLGRLSTDVGHPVVIVRVVNCLKQFTRGRLDGISN